MTSQPSLKRIRQEIQRLCYAGLDATSLRREVMRHLKAAVGFDACSLMTMDPATLMVTGAVTHGLNPGGARPVMTNEYLERDYNRLADLARGPQPVGLLEQATGGRPSLSRRYRELLPQAGLGSEMRAAFVTDGACWGGAFLYRFADQRPFAQAESAFLAAVSPQIAVGLRNAVLLGQAQAGQAPSGSGLLLLDGEDRVLSLSEAAERHLQALGSEWAGGTLPAPVFGLAARARGLAQGLGGAVPASLRIRSVGGAWYTFHATTLSGSVGGGSVAIMIEQARPAEVAPMLFAAYDLTPREQAVAQRVLAGYSTREIAESLYIAQHTVQDHLKAIFSKTGVSSRRELSGRIFFDQYFSGLR